ncbi:MAG: UDP-N-acetylmuramate dehydrogenase [Candidatus Vogelbacteria bacterium]|nr:UDP-N-acetylmuramate dehydrogenase [Candidatus Vogelbacteria bacterium]
MNVHENVDLKAYTTFGVAGVARWFAIARSEFDIDDAFKWAKSRGESILILGGGSNVAIADGIIEKLVLKISNNTIRVEGNKILCGAGTELSKLIRTANIKGLDGLEAMAGIPGTVGGAIVGNAAAYGQAIGDHLVRVQVMDYADTRFNPVTRLNLVNNETKTWISKAECEFAYHDSVFERKPAIIIQAEFEFDKAEADLLQKKSAEILKIRKKKFPKNAKYPGCFFKNVWANKVPKQVLAGIPNVKDYFGKVPAWYFLNEVGARGMIQGGLKVSETHGNLVLNENNASFNDVEALALELKKRVKEKFGVELEEEVRFVS